MSRICFQLFGSFQTLLAGEPVPDYLTGKPEELFCVLLLHRQTPTAREKIASLLWENTTTAQSKKYLRDALWKLQEKLCLVPGEAPVLLTSADCLRLNPQADVWVDVAEFETAFRAVETVSGSSLTPEQAQSLQHAVALYRGELLSGWYQEWCLCERARLQDLYLRMLHKLMLWAETNGEYELGTYYGESLLVCDAAHERAHRTLMRLRYLAGDRTGASMRASSDTSTIITWAIRLRLRGNFSRCWGCHGLILP